MSAPSPKARRRATTSPRSSCAMDLQPEGDLPPEGGSYLVKGESYPVKGESHRMSRIERRLLILWFALAFVVWNGVYDMRMHDAVRGYLLETAEAHAGLGGGVDMRQYL